MVDSVVPRLQHALLVAARHQHQRAVDRQHLVDEHRNIHRARFRHAVVARPGAVVLVPLPHFAVERGLRVDLELMHVELFAEHLLDRPDQPRMRAQQAERLVVGVRGEGGARRARLLAPDLLAIGAEDRLRLVAQHRHLLGREQVRQEQVALLVELLKLLLAECHRIDPPTLTWRGSRHRHKVPRP